MAEDADVGFIAGGDVIDGTFVFEIEAVAVVGGRLSVVENGLVRDADIKDVLQDESGFSGADGEGDVEGQDEPEDILGVVNSSDVDGRLDRSWMDKVGGLKQIFAVSIAEFELGGFGFS